MANNNLVYTTSGLRVKAAFYNKKAMVYIEGEDDIFFWEQFFGTKKYQVQDVGGCKNFERYYDLINDGLKTFIIAEDSDYKGFIYCGTSPLIIRTYSHSVENMMYCPKNLNHMIQRHCRSKVSCLRSINAYYADFMQKCHKLLVLDVANYIFGKGVKVLGDTCFRFLDQTRLPYINQDAVDNYYNSIVGKFTEEEIDEAERRIASDEREERLMIKGHFLTEAIRLFVDGYIKQNSNKNPRIDGDNLYALLVECIKVCEPECMERKFIQDQIKRAEKVLEF